MIYKKTNAYWRVSSNEDHSHIYAKLEMH